MDRPLFTAQLRLACHFELWVLPYVAVARGPLLQPDWTKLSFELA